MAANLTLQHSVTGFAEKSAITYWFQNLKSTLEKWERNHATRVQLAEMDPRLLEDIGINVEDVQEEVAKPFWK